MGGGESFPLSLKTRNTRNTTDSTINLVSVKLHFSGPPGLDILCLSRMYFCPTWRPLYNILNNSFIMFCLQLLGK
jgi:hypothetical protein